MMIGKQVVADGHRVEYCCDAAVYHYHHETWSQVRRRFEREAIALRQIMPEIQVAFLDALRYWTAGVFGDWSRAITEKSFVSNFIPILVYRANQYLGVRRGNRIHRELSRKAKERYFYPV